jgi:multisubunit Na+/H+ antiporter MnhB subunit
MVILFVLLGFMIIGALIAVEAKGLLSSVVAVGVVGLGISIAFLLLKAPDVAITQLVVEIIAVIILIRATIRRTLPGSPTGSRPLGAVLALGFIAVLILVAIPALKDLPEFGDPTMRVAQRYVEGSWELSGATNVVASVILDYRAYDTLGEATVLFTAVVGVLAVARVAGKKKKECGTAPTEEALGERGDE